MVTGVDQLAVSDLKEELERDFTAAVEACGKDYHKRQFEEIVMENPETFKRNGGKNGKKNEGRCVSISTMTQAQKREYLAKARRMGRDREKMRNRFYREMKVHEVAKEFFHWGYVPNALRAFSRFYISRMEKREEVADCNDIGLIPEKYHVDNMIRLPSVSNFVFLNNLLFEKDSPVANLLRNMHVNLMVDLPYRVYEILDDTPLNQLKDHCCKNSERLGLFPEILGRGVSFRGKKGITAADYIKCRNGNAPLPYKVEKYSRWMMKSGDIAKAVGIKGGSINLEKTGSGLSWLRAWIS